MGGGDPSEGCFIGGGPTCVNPPCDGGVDPPDWCQQSLLSTTGAELQACQICGGSYDAINDPEEGYAGGYCNFPDGGSWFCTGGVGGTACTYYPPDEDAIYDPWTGTPTVPISPSSPATPPSGPRGYIGGCGKGVRTPAVFIGSFRASGAMAYMMKANRTKRPISHSYWVLLVAAAALTLLIKNDSTPLPAASTANTTAQARVTRIGVGLVTTNRDGAGTDGTVFSGLGGREFNLDFPNIDDREQGAGDTYVFGEGANVSISLDNDPRTLAITMDDVNQFPIYIRMSDAGDFPEDSWNLDFVEVTVNPGPAQLKLSKLGRTGDGVNLWFTPQTGLIFYLKP
ncbi:MAG: hypothetical protein HY314_08715 [Acidobacteria bacterium]|nr:hypothetical protein [Acidobacteriota bacterium]